MGQTPNFDLRYVSDLLRMGGGKFTSGRRSTCGAPAGALLMPPMPTLAGFAAPAWTTKQQGDGWTSMQVHYMFALFNGWGEPEHLLTLANLFASAEASQACDVDW